MVTDTQSPLAFCQYLKTTFFQISYLIQTSLPDSDYYCLNTVVLEMAVLFKLG